MSLEADGHILSNSFNHVIYFPIVEWPQDGSLKCQWLHGNLHEYPVLTHGIGTHPWRDIDTKL